MSGHSVPRRASLRSLRAGAVLPLAFLAICSTATLSGCGSDSTTDNAGETGYVAGDGSIVVLANDKRKPAPDLTGTTLDGKSWALSDHKNQVVVMNVWASWCAPCRAEAPALARVADARQPEVAFVGLNTRDSTAPAKAFSEKFKLGYPSLVDPDGQLQLKFRETLPPSAIPSTVVIDKEGRVAARALGKISAAELNTMIDSVDQGFGKVGAGDASNAPDVSGSADASGSPAASGAADASGSPAASGSPTASPSASTPSSPSQ